MGTVRTGTNANEIVIPKIDMDGAVHILAEADEIRNKDIDYSSAIRQYCAIFLKFYDFLFGDGIKDNTRKYDAVYDSLISFISKQCEVSCNRMDEITKHYAPKKAKK